MGALAARYRGKTLDVAMTVFSQMGLAIPNFWFGIVLVKLIEISVVTPPVGVNLFAVLGAAGKETSVADVVRGVMPFIALEIVVLAILVTFPELSTWLPNQMLGR